MNANQVTAEDFSREYQNSLELARANHHNILRVFDGVFQCEGYFLFATEYAPLGDLTSNIQDGKEGSGLSETYTKRVTQQVSQGELSSQKLNLHLAQDPVTALIMTGKKNPDQSLFFPFYILFVVQKQI